MNIHFYCHELKLLVKSLGQVDEMILANFDFIEVSGIVASVLSKHLK